MLDSRLEAAIEELREKSEMEIAQYKLEVEAAYKDKVWRCPSQLAVQRGKLLWTEEKLSGLV